MSEDKVAVEIPRELFEKIKEMIAGTSFASVEQEMIAGTSFASVEQYVVLKLENEFPEEVEYSAEEEAIIRERLRRLGYIE